MTKEPVDKYFGISIREWIEMTPNELEVDAVGLWQIVPVGRDSFGLAGDELKGFVWKSVVALVEKGAAPARMSSENDKYWDWQTQYGESPEDIADSVIKEWVDSGVDPEMNGLWFSLKN